MNFVSLVRRRSGLRFLGGFRLFTSSKSVRLQKPKLSETHVAKHDEPAAEVLPELRTRSLLTSNLWHHRITDRISQITNNKKTHASVNTTDTNTQSEDRKMIDSFVQVFLPFRSDPFLIEEYLNPYGRVRFGKVLEDLDALAGSISYLHCSGANFTIVTASVDRIDMLKEIPKDQDISIFGYVTYVGNSSMEITIQMETVPQDVGITPADMDEQASRYRYTKLPESKRRDLILAAKFIMVARDPDTDKAAKVPQLRLDTDAEREIFANGALHKTRKQIESQSALIRKPPSVEEMSFVHDLYKEYNKYVYSENTHASVVKPDHIIWMKDTRLQNINLTYPQDRNIHNKIFGGYLMRLAYELGSTSAIIFSRSPLNFLSLDDVTFRRPVEIGAILDLHAQVVYTRENKMVVKVVAHVLDAQSGSRELSNEFWLTFEAVSPVPGEKRRVIPRSYNDCMLCLEGKRRLTVEK
ncbi:hypothetical protein HK100_010412 [Physocladia obscura]|uniref:HotDog ACOT-type domain-containing protein n=1 Tax=Physocladia obscura TaxID=109957 RepID=A0AAD5XEQ2_9FUNG|nr:hypothetical protein HK100_010412 [Physocladia obscura]